MVCRRALEELAIWLGVERKISEAPVKTD